jgi:hypothetical protein
LYIFVENVLALHLLTLCQCELCQLWLIWRYIAIFVEKFRRKIEISSKWFLKNLCAFPNHYELSQLSSPIFMLFVQENAVAHARKCFKLLSGKIFFDLCSCCFERLGPSLGIIQDPSNRLNTTHGHSAWLSLADQAQIIDLYFAVLYITSTQYL